MLCLQYCQDRSVNVYLASTRSFILPASTAKVAYVLHVTVLLTVVVGHGKSARLGKMAVCYDCSEM